MGLVALLMIAAACWPAAADASFPGANGKIAFSWSGGPAGSGIYVINPDGTNPTLINADGYNPAWSPDGQQIAFTGFADGSREIYKMNADGTGVTRLTNDPRFDDSPAWSPDGQKIVFIRRDSSNDLWTMNADGTSQVPVALTTVSEEADPSWSPDGQWIAYYRDNETGSPGPECRVKKIHPDGTSRTSLTPAIDGYPPQSQPDWAPEGTLIVYVGSCLSGTSGLWTMQPDGTNLVELSPFDYFDPAWSPDGGQLVAHQLTPDQGFGQIVTLGENGQSPHVLTSTGSAFGADWQPLPPAPPHPGYPRPKGATPLRVSLVPAFSGCGSPNSGHGDPLSFPSCAPPAEAGSNLTLGTPDANGQEANLTGQVKYSVVAGDVAINAAITDVRCRTSTVGTCTGGVLSDYTGELSLAPSLRLTDRLNGHTREWPATSDIPAPPQYGFWIAVPCAQTPDVLIGADCELSTTFNAVLPGAVVAGKRAIWELGQIEVWDGGEDGTANTDDNTPFLVQGLFVP